MHQFRVELKKINAFLHFIEHTRSKKVVAEAGKQITEWLQEAGELRDAHNFVKLADEFKLPKSISGKTIRRGQLKKAAGKLKSWRRHPHSLNLTARQLNNHAKKLTPAQLEKYLTGLMSDISGAISKTIPEDKLHELRKKMKDAMYLLKLSADKNPDKKTKQLMEKLDECQDVIGQWHDINKFHERIKKVKHAHLKAKVPAVKEEEKRLLTEIYRLLTLLK